MTDTFVGHVKYFLLLYFSDQLGLIVIAVCAISALLSLASYVGPSPAPTPQNVVREHLICNDLFLAARVLSVPIALLIVFGDVQNFGPFLRFADAVVLHTAPRLIMLVAAMSLTAPLLLDFGLVQFAAVLAEPVMKPLFKVPGRAAVDCLASWLGSSSMAVVISAKMYARGHYTSRESAIMVTSFSLAGIYNIYALAEILNMTYAFAEILACVYAVMFLLAMLLPRMWPLKVIPNEYLPSAPVHSHEWHEHNDRGILRTALARGEGWASHMTMKRYFGEALAIALPILLGTVPLMITCGTFLTVIAEMTPIVDVLSTPFLWLLNVLGTVEASGIANTAVFAFVDQFLAATYGAVLLTEEARFIAICLTAIGLINLTEIVIHVWDTAIPLKLWQMAVIYLMRVSLAVFIIVPVGDFLFG